MPKCRKRRICREPDYVIFQSENGLDDVTTLTVDEYEAIRQIDMEGLSQEECAKKMCVARTTALSLSGCCFSHPDSTKSITARNTII